MTSAYAEPPIGLTASGEVYAPQHDSRLLVDAMRDLDLHGGHRVVDLCTGSGVVAISAAAGGAGTVTALDISMAAVRCARANALAAGVDVDVRHGSWSRAAEFGPFDVVLCNPPYVPEPSDDDAEAIPRHAGPPAAFDGGLDGRRVLDPLCAAAPALLAAGGTMLLVHSEFSGEAASLTTLRQGRVEGVGDCAPTCSVRPGASWRGPDGSNAAVCSTADGGWRNWWSSGPTFHERPDRTRGDDRRGRPDHGGGAGAHRGAGRHDRGVRPIHGRHVYVPEKQDLPAVRHQPSAPKQGRCRQARGRRSDDSPAPAPIKWSARRSSTRLKARMPNTTSASRCGSGPPGRRRRRSAPPARARRRPRRVPGRSGCTPRGHRIGERVHQSA